ncbi:MAG: hypothetical protein H6737_13550 [Alphaproteobacteria bacterium]|nr:hypothetical protein [Alphaproteobacteria bacterium]
MDRILPLTFLALFACTGETTDLEIAGAYTDDFGGLHDISQDTWVMDGVGVFHILTVDADADFLVAQNDAANDYNPDLYSRMDWLDDGTDLWFCQIAYDAATEADATAATGADRSDTTSGCGGFGWTRLVAR